MYRFLLESGGGACGGCADSADQTAIVAPSTRHGGLSGRVANKLMNNKRRINFLEKKCDKSPSLNFESVDSC